MKSIAQKALTAIRNSPDVILACGVAAIIAALVIPLPGWALDIGLSLNLAASAGLLVTALYARDALAVTSFPTLLLVSTLFRLALNVSSTRLALAEGHAGEIIQAFGEFVMRGDYWVGGAIFAILTIVQFLVVAKGAERVAEVSARFTLDAMPGKQMAIDADLRAGIIDAPQARRRRSQLERESQMFGAMDRRHEFVKGDVIAGLIIVAINLCAGSAIGTLQHGLGFGEAVTTYALIAVGDGLVSQLPSLCIALAAGLVVTRVASEEEGGSLGADIARQFFTQPKVLWVVAGLCAALLFIPGMPHLTLGALAVGLGAAASHLGSKGSLAAPAKKGRNGELAAAEPAPAQRIVGVAPLAFELAPDLSALVEADATWTSDRLEQVREQLYLELGFRPAAFQVRLHAKQLSAGGYRILLDEVPMAQGCVGAGGLYALCKPEEVAYLGVLGDAVPLQSVLSRPLMKVDREDREALETAGIPVMTALEVIANQVSALLRRHASLLLGLQDVRVLVDELEGLVPALVQETLQKVPLPLLTEVLRQLLVEEVSIRNLRAIFEALASPATEGDASALVERCRQGLFRYITHKYAPEGPLFAYLADPSVEDALRAQGSASFALEPEKIERILKNMRSIALQGRVVVLTAPDTRRSLRRLCEGSVPEVAVLTYRELDPGLQIRPLGRLSAVETEVA